MTSNPAVTSSPASVIRRRVVGSQGVVWPNRVASGRAVPGPRLHRHQPGTSGRTSRRPSATSVPLMGAMSRVRWPRSRSRDRCSPTSRHRSPAAGTIRPEWARASTNTSRDERRGKPRGQGIVGSVLRCCQSPASSQQQAPFAVAEAAQWCDFGLGTGRDLPRIGSIAL